MRVQPGKGGQMVGKQTGFVHMAPGSTRLCPDKSTQAVDFPRMYEVRVFLSGVKFSFQSQVELGTNVGKLGGNGKGAEDPGMREMLRIVTGKVRDVSRKSTKVRTDQARKSAMLRIVTGKTNFFD